MKKLLAITILGMLFCNTSFALSPERERVEHNSCVEGLLSSGNSIVYANKYCVCSVNMISKKYSDKKLDKIVSKGWDYMMKKIKFASDHCKKNVLKINNVPIKLICHMHDPDKMLSPQRLTLLPDSKNFLVDGQTGSYRESSSMYGGTYYLDDIKIKWRLDRYTGGISYDISRGGEQMYQTGECQNSSNQGTKF
jgi:hypothetical protein